MDYKKLLIILLLSFFSSTYGWWFFFDGEGGVGGNVTCTRTSEDLPGDPIDTTMIPIVYSSDFILTKPAGFEIIPTNNGPYIAPNISEINLMNQQNNINLLGGLSSIFQFSAPYGSPASFASVTSGTTFIIATSGTTIVINPGVLQTKVFSISPQMNGNCSVVYNARGFPESEFELNAPMVAHGAYGNFSSRFLLPVSNITKLINPDFTIKRTLFSVSCYDNNTGESWSCSVEVDYKGTLEITKNATLREFAYPNVPFLALTHNIPMSAFPELSLNWNIQPFGFSGSYYIFSSLNTLGQETNGRVTVRDVAVGLVYSYLVGGISKDELLAGIKNVIYHALKVPVSSVGNSQQDPAVKAANQISNAISNPNFLNSPGDKFVKAKGIVSAVDPPTLSVSLPQKYLLDPFVFNGSEMLVASYKNSTRHNLYELWYINETSYYNPMFYYKDSFPTDVIAVGGTGNKIYTVEKSDEGYSLNTYEIIPFGYKNPSSPIPYNTNDAILKAPIDSDPNKKKLFTSVYSEFNASWSRFFGRVLYDETHDLYKSGSRLLPNCEKFISFTVDKYTGIAYVFCLTGYTTETDPNGNTAYIYDTYTVYDSNGNSKTLFGYNDDYNNAKIASFGSLFFLTSKLIPGSISEYKNNGTSFIGINAIPINYTDLNISLYANYAYNKPNCNVVNDKGSNHNILAMSIYNGFIYLVDHWTPGCGIDEVRLRMVDIGSQVDVLINPFLNEDRLDCFRNNSCGKNSVSPPYGWILASNRPDHSLYTFYPQQNENFGFPEIGAPLSNSYSANMSIDDFGRIYLVTSGSGKSLAIIDLQPSNYTLYSFGAGSLYACIQSSTSSGSYVIVEKKGIGTKEITQNTKCFSGSSDILSKINYIYGAPNILNHLNQIYALPIGSIFSGPGISTNIAAVNKGMALFNNEAFYQQAQLLPKLEYPTSKTTLKSSVGGEFILPFYSLYLFNQTSNVTYTHYSVTSYGDCNVSDEEIDAHKPPKTQIIPYPGPKEVYARYTFSTTYANLNAQQPIEAKFESSNLIFVIYSLVNGTISPVFLYQKSLPQQIVSVSLFEILGFGSKPFGETYINVTPISAYGTSTDNRRSTISKIRLFDYITQVWKIKGTNTVLYATGITKQIEGGDKNLQKDYYFNVNNVIQSAAEILNTPINLAIASAMVFPSQYFSAEVPIINRKVPYLAFVENILSIFSSDNLLGRRSMNVTFVDLFNSTFNLPMRLDLAYSTKINATLNTSIDKNNRNLTHVTVRGNLSKVVFDRQTNTVKYEPISGRIYAYVNRNINYCNKPIIVYYGGVYIPACSQNLATQNPLEAIRCSLGLEKHCILANPLNFTRENIPMEPVANVINYQPSDPLEKKNTICNINGDTYPSVCTNGYFCLPIYPNGTGYCTSQIGLVNITDTSSNGEFKFNFDIYGFGLGEKLILQYYGYPKFQKVTTFDIYHNQHTQYIENYAYLPATTVLSFNYGLLPLRIGDFLSFFVILVICLSVILAFIFRKKKTKD